MQNRKLKNSELNQNFTAIAATNSFDFNLDNIRLNNTGSVVLQMLFLLKNIPLVPLPHATKDIQTALSATDSVGWEYVDDVVTLYNITRRRC